MLKIIIENKNLRRNLDKSSFYAQRLKKNNLFLFVMLITLISFSCCSSVKDINTPPRGYRNNTFLKVAYFLGMVDLINMEPEIPSELIEYKDIEYRNIDGKALKLDIYRPKVMPRPAPVLIFIHGGSWKSGKKEDYKCYTLDFAKRGYVTASISYRLLPHSNFPDAVEDVKCAVRWIRAHAADYHIDPQKIAVIGGSAGGHLAMMVGYSSDIPDFDVCIEDSTSSCVQAVVNLYGPVDLTTDYTKGHSIIIDFIGKSYEENPVGYEQASPIKYISNDDPPTLIFHGTIDDLVPVSQADSLKKILDKADVANEYYRLKGWPHAMDVAQPVNNYCKNKMMNFFNRYIPLPK